LHATLRYAQQYEGAAPPSVSPELFVSLKLTGSLTYINTEGLTYKEGGHWTNVTYIHMERQTEEGGTPDKMWHTNIWKEGGHQTKCGIHTNGKRGGHRKNLINFLAISSDSKHFSFFQKKWKIHPPSKSYLFWAFKPHAKFQNPTITPSGRKNSDEQTNIRTCSFIYIDGTTD
jgi:hypothetical protein